MQQNLKLVAWKKFENICTVELLARDYLYKENKAEANNRMLHRRIKSNQKKKKRIKI